MVKSHRKGESFTTMLLGSPVPYSWYTNGAHSTPFLVWRPTRSDLYLSYLLWHIGRKREKVLFLKVVKIRVVNYKIVMSGRTSRACNFIQNYKLAFNLYFSCASIVQTVSPRFCENKQLLYIDLNFKSLTAFKAWCIQYKDRYIAAPSHHNQKISFLMHSKKMKITNKSQFIFSFVFNFMQNDIMVVELKVIWLCFTISVKTPLYIFIQVSVDQILNSVLMF